MTEDRAEAIHLIEEVPEEKIEQVVRYLRSVTEPRQPKEHRDAWMAVGPANNGRTDNASRVDEILAQGFGR